MKNFLRVVMILAVVGVCMLLAVGALAAVLLPRMAETRFGPPSTLLSPVQRIIYSFRLVSNEETLLNGLDDQAPIRDFQIEMGESVNSISTRLEEQGLIANADAFRTYLIYSGKDTLVQAGKYHLSPSMSPVEIAQKVLDPVPEEVEFVILAGWRAEEIAAVLPTSGLSVSGDEFLSLVNHPPADILPAGFPQLSTLEGFLLPGSYQIKREISARDLLAVFLRRFDESVPQTLRSAYADQGLDLSQAVILASIVQREAVVVDEQPIIASVFYNRIRMGMKLESDPTVQYALALQSPDQGWWKTPLSSADLQIDSRYNTYVYPGFPPGPISNPGIDALQSVANPAQTDFYYFRALCDQSGRHAFAVTYEEHLNNGCP